MTNKRLVNRMIVGYLPVNNNQGSDWSCHDEAKSNMD